MTDEGHVPDTTTTADGSGTPTGTGTPATPDGKKKIELDEATQQFLNSKIEQTYGKAYSKAEKLYAGQITEAQARIESLQKELEDLKTAAKAPDPKKGEPAPPKVAEGPTDEVLKAQAQYKEMVDAFKVVKDERDALKANLSTAEQKRREATIRDRFLAAVPDGIVPFSPNEAYLLVMNEGQLQLDDSGGNLVVINPATGHPRLGRDAEPMSPGEYIAEFFGKRPWMVKSESAGGTGATESRKMVAATPGSAKSVKDLTAEELEQMIQATKNRAV